jgi:hypothetical protein
MGDDYPAVLRQMKRYKNSKISDPYERRLIFDNNDRRFMLIVEKYNGKGLPGKML